MKVKTWENVCENWSVWAEKKAKKKNTPKTNNYANGHAII